MARYFVVIPCAGNGSRFKSDLPKQYHLLEGQTVLDWTLSAFEQIDEITEIVIVANSDDTLINDYALRYPKLSITKVGGETRAQSVINGIAGLNCQPDDWILVHDAARCCVSPPDIKRLIRELNSSAVGGILAQKAVDTIKQVDAHSQISHTLERNFIYLAQTPQMFRAGILQKALSQADSSQITDEASAVELLGLPVKVIACTNYNIKITHPEDIFLAQAILNRRKPK